MLALVSLESLIPLGDPIRHMRTLVDGILRTLLGRERRPGPARYPSAVPIYLLTSALAFPDPRLADRSGLLAVGGDLRPERLLLAYRSGIFPWYSDDQPILWHSPDPRFVLLPSEFRVPRTLRQTLRKRPYRLTLDTRFGEVVAACAETPRAGQDGTWITSDMQSAYAALHERGYAHSVEAWDGDVLVGGLYGIAIGSAFFGESMFSWRDEASKVAFACFVPFLVRRGLTVLDSQVHTAHVARFGAREIPRGDYLARLAVAVTVETRCESMHWDIDPYAPWVGGPLS
jgi:leucyl/phenylalanyl-tRNA--protein transferase